MSEVDYLDFSNYVRVLRLASVPSRDEFEKVALVAGGGIILIGFLGFVIYGLMSFLPT